MVTLAARRFSKVRPYSYADARLETRHAQLVPDLPLRLCGAWLTRGPDRILTRRPQAPRPSCCSQPRGRWAVCASSGTCPILEA